VLIAADDAIKSAAEAGDRTSKKVDKKFRKAIDMLGCFEKDFPVKGPSDPNIVEMDTRKAKISDESRCPSTILYALKDNLHSKVKFPLVFFTFQH
jgi:hypothetical protein